MGVRGLKTIIRTSAQSLRQRTLWLGLSIAVAAIVSGIALAASHGQAADEKPSAIKLSIDDFKLTFSEEFDELNVCAWGPVNPENCRWMAHTPWAGDFGDAAFADPEPDFPFTIKDGILRIEAKKKNGKWYSGLMASADRSGRGFMQQFGYFEIRTKLPPGPGLWSAFWLIGDNDPDNRAEMDVFEHYGHAPDTLQTVFHVWKKTEKGDPSDGLKVIKVPPGSLYDTFNTYGVEIDPEWTVVYLNRKERARFKTPKKFHTPMYVLFNLALGSGWPIDKTPNPSHMYVDYVRVWERK